MHHNNLLSVLFSVSLSYSFSGNGIGDAGVQILFEGLKHCVDMKELK